MSKIIDYMQELGLTDCKKVEKYFSETSIETIQALNEQIRKLAYEDWKIEEYTPYLFVPSSDLSGFGGCSELGCKTRRADRFARYACLYSDVVYLLVESITTPHRPEFERENEDYFRYEMICDFSLIHQYSNLIKRNIARIVPPNFGVCQDCYKRFVFDEKQLAQLDPLLHEYSTKAKIKAIDYNDKTKTGIISIGNLPEMFPDHDVYISIYGSDVHNLLKGTKRFPTIIEKKDFVEDIIKDQIYQHYLTSRFETFMSSTYQSKYITAKPFDKMMIDTISRKTIGGTNAPVFEMPFLENISIDTLLRIRDTEHHSFNDYRIALDKATKLYVANQNSVEAKDIYDDIVYPAFVKLDEMFERTNRMQTFKAIGGFAVIASTVTLGIMNQVPPVNFFGLIAAAGGTGALIQQITEVVERKMQTTDELESKDFYFLWKLKQEGK